jgi:hypothetical protein
MVTYTLFFEHGHRNLDIAHCAGVVEDLQRALGGYIQRIHFAGRATPHIKDRIGFCLQDPSPDYYNYSAAAYFGVDIIGPFLVQRCFLVG